MGKNHIHYRKSYEQKQRYNFEYQDDELKEIYYRKLYEEKEENHRRELYNYNRIYESLETEEKFSKVKVSLRRNKLKKINEK